MKFETRVALKGIRLNSTPEDVRSLPYAGTGKVADGGVVAISEDGETCKKAEASDKDFGVVVFQHIGKSGRTDDGKEEAYVEFDVVPVMTQGRIYVEPAEPVTERGRDKKVYVTADGKLSAVAEGNTEFVGAHWDVPSNADGLAVVNIK